MSSILSLQRMFGPSIRDAGNSPCSDFITAVKCDHQCRMQILSLRKFRHVALDVGFLKMKYYITK